MFNIDNYLNRILYSNHQLHTSLKSQQNHIKKPVNMPSIRIYLELKLSALSKLGYAIFFQVKTTTHFIRLTPVKLFIGCFFFFVQLNNYISNLSLLKYFIHKIYGKRDISQQAVTLSKFGNARTVRLFTQIHSNILKYTQIHSKTLK